MRCVKWGVALACAGIVAAMAWVLRETAPAEDDQASTPMAIVGDSPARPQPDGFVARRNAGPPDTAVLPPAIDRTPAPTATLVGRVMLSTGTAAAFALVRVRYSDVGAAATPSLVTGSPDFAGVDEVFARSRTRDLVRETRTEADGSFRLDGLRAPAAVCVDIEPAAHANARPTTIDGVGLRGDTTTTLPDVHLQAGARIDGRVVDHDGNALARALVATHDGRTVTADALGRFVFEGLPDGTFDLSAAHDDALLVANVERVQVAAGRTGFVRIELPRAAHVAGRVVDQHGVAVRGADVVVEFEAIGITGIEVRGRRTTSDASGSFDIGGVRRDAECRVRATAVGYASHALADDGTNARDTSAWAVAGDTNVGLTLFRLPRVSLSCVDARTQRPIDVTSIQVGSSMLTGDALAAACVRPGHYAITVPSRTEDTAKIRVVAAGFAEQTIDDVRASGDIDVGTVAFEPSAPEAGAPPALMGFSGRVIDATSGTGIPDAFVDVLGAPPDVDGVDYEALTNRDGSFELVLRASDIAAGDAALSVRACAASHAPEVVSLRDATCITLWPRGRRDAKGSVTGRVIGRDGKPAAGLELICNGRSTLTDELGVFAFSRLDVSTPDEVRRAPLAWSIEPALTLALRRRCVRVDPQASDLPAAWRFDVTERVPEVELAIDLRPHTGSLRGFVRVNGQNVPGLQVELTEPTVHRFPSDELDSVEQPRTLLATTAGADGSYAFPLLIPLSGEVRVTRNGRLLGQPHAFRVGAGDDATVHLAITTETLRGRVLGGLPNSERPLVTARCVDRSLESAGVSVTEAVVTRGDGSFELVDVVAGTYLVTAWTLDQVAPAQTVEIGGGGDASVELELMRTYRVVLDATTWSARDEESMTLTDAEGRSATLTKRRDLRERAYFDRVPAGAYALRWTSDREPLVADAARSRTIVVGGDARDIVVTREP